MFDDIKTSHRCIPSLQLNLEEQRTPNIQPNSGSGILQSPTQRTPPNIHGVKQRENHVSQSRILSSRGRPPPPPVRANRPQVNMRGPPPPPPPPLGASGPPPFPIPRFAPGDPPPPPPFGASGTVRISDITPGPALTEDYCRRQLTIYEVYTLRKAEPLPTIEEKDSNKTSRSSSSKSAPKPSWQRVLINREAFDQKDIIKQIKKLDQTTRSVTTKKAALFPNQHTQVTNLVDEKIATEIDPAFTWTLAQLDRKEVTNRSTGNKETQAMIVYLKRALSPGVDPISIFSNIERNRKQNYSFYNPAPGIGSEISRKSAEGGLDEFKGSQKLGAKVDNDKVAPGIVIVGDERKDSKSTLGEGTGDAPQENGRPKKSSKDHKTGRGYFSDSSSTVSSDSDASWSTNSETSTFETSISSAPSTRRSRHHTGSSHRARDPYRRHEKVDVIRETLRRRPSATYVPEPPRVIDARQAAKVAEYERSSLISTRTTGSNDSGYVSQGVSSLEAAFAAGVAAATRVAVTQRRPPDLSPWAPRSNAYRDDRSRRSFDDEFRDLHIRDDLSLDSNIRRREDCSLDFRDEYCRDDLIRDDKIRVNERRRDPLDLSRMESRLGGQCEDDRKFEYTKKPFAPSRRWSDNSRD